MRADIKKHFIDVSAGFHAFGRSISTVVNTMLLGMVYVIGIGAAAVIARMRQKHFLDMAIDRRASYWLDLDLKKKPREEYDRQF